MISLLALFNPLWRALYKSVCTPPRKSQSLKITPMTNQISDKMEALSNSLCDENITQQSTKCLKIQNYLSKFKCFGHFHLWVESSLGINWNVHMKNQFHEVDIRGAFASWTEIDCTPDIARSVKTSPTKAVTLYDLWIDAKMWEKLGHGQAARLAFP